MTQKEFEQIINSRVGEVWLYEPDFNRTIRSCYLVICVLQVWRSGRHGWQAQYHGIDLYDGVTRTYGEKATRLWDEDFDMCRVTEAPAGFGQ